mmetsp:Transcript_25474/g.70263  ORF Transcript_25474/g.70263 Transcript_25474/m.70263 type:complete len:117 (+) Transcript_25474:209-559(+)
MHGGHAWRVQKVRYVLLLLLLQLLLLLVIDKKKKMAKVESGYDRNPFRGAIPLKAAGGICHTYVHASEILGIGAVVHRSQPSSRLLLEAIYSVASRMTLARRTRGPSGSSNKCNPP